MKFLQTIKKNFKVLFRLRLSLIAIILGPVLVLSLIGVAFNSSTNIQLVVGYHSPDNSTLGQEIVQTLESKNYIVKPYESSDACVKELQLGLVNTCVIFPDDFRIEKDRTSEITFYVDKSRVNIAYNVIDGVSENIGLKSDELSKSLTDTLTNTLTDASSDIDDTLALIIKTKKNLDDANADAQTISSDLAGMDLDIKDGGIDVSDDIDELARYTKNLAEDAYDVYTDGIALINELSPSDGNESQVLDDLEQLLEDLNESATDKHNDSKVLSLSLITDIADQVEEIEDQFDSAKKLNENSRDKIASLKTKLSAITEDITTARDILERIVTKINTIEITSSEQIVNPITTRIETVASDSNQLVILFPYVLMLIIMFVGMMLSSTLVVVEKKSKASFRIFTTPTRDEFFILTTFITAFIIVALQTLIILGAASFFLVDVLTANLWLNVLIIALSAAIFIMIGMAIGYLLSNQQGTNMASISIGAIFLFISNVVLPLESISPYLREAANYNPYVISSEVLRKSILFGISIYDIPRELAILSLYSVLVVGLIIIFQQVSKSKFFKKHNVVTTKTKKVSYSHEYLYIQNERVSNEKEFLKKITSITDKEYKKIRRKQHKDLAIFIKERLNKASIAKRVHRLSRTQLIAEFKEENTQLINKLKNSQENKNKK